MYLTNRPQLITVNATLLDTAQRPIPGAMIFVYDAAHHALPGANDLAFFSGFDGQVTVHVIVYVPINDTYYIEGNADGYLPTTTMVTSAEQTISVTLVLKPKPLPDYPLTTVRGKIVDEVGQPVFLASMDILDASGDYMDNWYNADVSSDQQGMIEKTVRTGGVYTIRVDANGYARRSRKVDSKPGVIPLTIVMKRDD